MMRQKNSYSLFESLICEIMHCTRAGGGQSPGASHTVQHRAEHSTLHCTLYIIQAQDSSGSVPSDTG